jgi:hypothetical protein
MEAAALPDGNGAATAAIVEESPYVAERDRLADRLG